MRIRSCLPFVLGLTLGCSGAPPATDTQQQALEGGNVDNGDPAVVLWWRPDNRESCTGSLVGPGIVLTAAHCVDGIDTTKGRPVVYTGTGLGGQRNSNPSLDWDPSRDPTLTAHSVISWWVNPGYVNNATCPNTDDVAMVRLGDLAGNVYLKYAHPGDTLPPVGTQIYSVGYGDHSGIDGQKRDADQTVIAVDGATIQVQWGSDGNAGFAGGGDSGGPIIYNGEIVGTTMCHNRSGDTEYYERTDQLASFIDQAVQSWEQDCANSCWSEEQACGGGCYCLVGYYNCLHYSCGQPLRHIFCPPL